MTILKEGTSHWPDNDQKTMSQSKFKLRTSERALGESYKYFVRIWFGLRSQKWAIIKEGASYLLAWEQRKDKVTKQLQTNIF